MQFPPLKDDSISGEEFLALPRRERVLRTLDVAFPASALPATISALIAAPPGEAGRAMQITLAIVVALAVGAALVAAIAARAEVLRSRTAAGVVGLAAGALQFVAAAGAAALAGPLSESAAVLALGPIAAAALGGMIAHEVMFPDGEDPASAGGLPRGISRILHALARALHVRRRRRDSERMTEAAAEPFPAAWEEILHRNVRLSRQLDDGERERLRALVRVFLADVAMEGAGGLELTDEIRVTIAGQACMLLLRLELTGYPDVRTVIVYPSTYTGRRPYGHRHGEDDPTPLLGESWGRGGVVVLSWDSARGGAANATDGRNVVLHEFAHQLDQEDGSADGIPYLPDWPTHVEWARLLATHHARLRWDVDEGRKTVMDAYGATNPAEFFAVATECFFEKPLQMRRRHPELYEELRDYFGQDPAAWPARAAAREKSGETEMRDKG